MSVWQITDGLNNLRSQVNRFFPDRDRKSDGVIGDTAHQKSSSGHNPDDTPGSKAEWDGDGDKDPEVRAWDMDSDLRTPGVTTQQVVDHIRKLPGVEKVLRYIIFNRKIYHADNDFESRPYGGASPHEEHVHFSGARSQAADNDKAFNYRFDHLFQKENDVPLSDVEIDKIGAATAKAVWGYRFDDPYTADDPKNPGADDKTAGTMQRYADSRGQGIESQRRLDDIGQQLSSLAALNAELKAAVEAMKPKA